VDRQIGSPQPYDIASLIDHTLLKPDASQKQIVTLCQEARQHGFATVCINPAWVPLAYRDLIGSPVKVCTVIGFPLGANETATKMFEAEHALAHGASELDMVMNVGALQSQSADVVSTEIAELARLAHTHRAILKVILETCLLDDAQKRLACELCVDSGADFVKTSTGFSTGGATVEDVRLMHQSVAGRARVKASGGIRTLAVLRKMVDAGATRIGTSSGLSILRECMLPQTQPEAQSNDY
jgi:deoxyribose-phosphate aldolase